MSNERTYVAGYLTAYGAAKRGGYTGSYDDFCAMFVNLDSIVSDLDDFTVTITMLSPGATPLANYHDGVLSLSIPQGQKGDKGDKGDKGNTGNTGPTGLTPALSIGTVSTLEPDQDATVTITGTTDAPVLNLGIPRGVKGDTGEVTQAELDAVADDVSDLKDALEAFPNGNYPNMTVGNAEQLVSTVGITDKVPYLFRTSGGSVDIGDRETDEIVGGSVVWNQLVNTSDTSVTVTSGHKYYSKINGTKTIGASSGTAITINDASEDNVHDLTQMFGTTIADYIYSLETANAGAGVAWFRKLFPKDYYPYNPGEIMSVSGVSSHEMTGFNQFDKTGNPFVYTNINTAGKTGLIKVVPGATYQLSIDYTANLSGVYIDWFDELETAISTSFEYSSKDASGTAPNNAYYAKIRFYHVSGADISVINDNTCFHLVWDGERDGEYEPYVKHSHPLDDSLTLRGIPKLDSNNNLYYDGDTYESDGTVTRRYGVVDLGTLSWGADSTRPGVFYSSGIASLIKKISNTGADMICIPYTTSKGPVPSAAGLASHDKQIGSYPSYGSGYIFIVDTSHAGDAGATFKTAMSGVYLIYELATPTTETADPFQSPQMVDDWGTEEYVTTGIVPVGHVTKYQPNLRAKLEMSPNSPDGDGDYLVRQTNGENEYVEYVSPVPSAPAENGTYKLRCVVSGGTPAFSWVSDT